MIVTIHFINPGQSNVLIDCDAAVQDGNTLKTFNYNKAYVHTGRYCGTLQEGMVAQAKWWPMANIEHWTTT